MSRLRATDLDFLQPDIQGVSVKWLSFLGAWWNLPSVKQAISIRSNQSLLLGSFLSCVVLIFRAKNEPNNFAKRISARQQVFAAAISAKLHIVRQEAEERPTRY